VNGAASIRESYADTLRKYLEGRNETALVQAYELGRNALNSGVGVLDMATIQHEAIVASLTRLGLAEPVRRHLEASQRCFMETLAAFEMTHRRIHEANAALRHFNDTLEAEIKRIAHILHGETGQLLAAIHLEFDALALGAASGSDKGRQRMRELLTRVEAQMRHLTHEIRPTVLDDLGLLAAIEFLREGVESRSDLRVLVEGPVAERYPQSIETAVYRIVQEALNNVVKHAAASQVVVRLTTEGERLVCAIRDDGVGFDFARLATASGERGFGLPGMRERLLQVRGTLEVRSAPGQGTEITVSIPLVN
jgi:signal transduction histidine kinase